MRNNLHIITFEFTGAFILNQFEQHTAAHQAASRSHLGVCEALVVAEVEISLSAIFGDKTLAMFTWVEQSSIYVKIRITFLESNTLNEEMLTEHSITYCFGLESDAINHPNDLAHTLGLLPLYPADGAHRQVHCLRAGFGLVAHAPGQGIHLLERRAVACADSLSENAGAGLLQAGSLTLAPRVPSNT